MASNSRYLKISSSVLMEYIYTDPSSPETISTATAPWYKMVNGHDAKEYYFNDDNSASLTSNVRDRAAALIDSTLNRYSYLNIDEIRAYNDIDDQLTDTANLPIGFTGPDGIEFDTVRLHLQQGFNFEENEGFLFEIEYGRLDDKISKAASLAYLKSDDFATLNPTPFLFSGKSYSSYVEIKIPSLRFLISEYNTEYVTGGDDDILSYKMSGGSGFRSLDPINVRFGFIDSKERINGNEFFYVTAQDEFSLPKEDQYSLLAAIVTPAKGADYIEIYGQHDGDVYEDFIQGLNNSGGDYIAFHQITVSEQLGTSWITTQISEIQQTSDFDAVMKFRPIIESANAVAYKIDYNLRLLNRNDNSTILKTGSYTSSDVAKYGRKLVKINLGSNPIVTNVYNKVYDNVVNFSKRGGNEIPKPSNYRHYVTSFWDISNLVMNSETVFFDNNGDIVSSEQATNLAFGQGVGELIIAPFNSYHKIILSEKKNERLQGKDLSGVGTICLNFKNSDGNVICIDEFITNKTNKAKGEVLFKVDTIKAEEIVSLKEKAFYITSKTEEGIETLIYTGSFLSSSEFPELSQTAEIQRLKSEFDKLEQDINRLKRWVDHTERWSDWVKDNIRNPNRFAKGSLRFIATVDPGLDRIKGITDALAEKIKKL